MTLLWLIFFSLVAFTERSQDSILGASNSHSQDSIHAPGTGAIDQAVSSFLLHPALSDMDNQSWNWEEVGEQLRLEEVFFNRDPHLLFGFLYHIETQNAHPDNVHAVFQGFYSYLTSKGYDLTKVAISMRQTIGHHSLAHMALRGPPNFIDRKVFKVRIWLMELETKGKVFNFLLSSLRIIKGSIAPFFLNFDYLKDIILYLMLKETVNQIEEIAIK